MIKLHIIWHVVPIVFIGFNRLPNKWVATCLGLFVLIRQNHFSDMPTIAHELEHSKQCIKGLGFVHGFRYYLSADYRLHCEAKAFAAEIACATKIANRAGSACDTSSAISVRTAQAIDLIVHCYGLRCSPEEARTALRAALSTALHKIDR